MPWGGLRHAGPYHSQNTEPWFYRTPGLKIVVPSTPHDARALMAAAVADPDPVLYYEHIALYRDPRDQAGCCRRARRRRCRSARRRCGGRATTSRSSPTAPTCTSALRVAETAGRGRHRGRACSTCAASRRSTGTRVLAVARHCSTRADRPRGLAHRRHRREPGRDHPGRGVRVARRAGARSSARSTRRCRIRRRSRSSSCPARPRSSARRGCWPRTDQRSPLEPPPAAPPGTAWPDSDAGGPRACPDIIRLMIGGPLRRILHVDMDAFYASVEQRDDPSLRGRPVAVGGAPDGARRRRAPRATRRAKFGVRSAMPMSRAVRLCPQLVDRPAGLPASTARCRSRCSRSSATVTPLVEPLSLDEAYLDVTENALGASRSASTSRAASRQRIREETRLTASAGVAPNKFLAKIASGWKKPDGLTVIAPERVEASSRSCPSTRSGASGPVTARKLRAAGIDEARRRARRGRRGRSARPSEAGPSGCAVSPSERTTGRSSPTASASRVGCEETYAKDLDGPRARFATEIDALARHAAACLERKELLARTVTLKVRYNDFTTITRSDTRTRRRATPRRSPLAPWRCSRRPKPAGGRCACSASCVHGLGAFRRRTRSPGRRRAAARPAGRGRSAAPKRRAARDCRRSFRPRSGTPRPRSGRSAGEQQGVSRPCARDEPLELRTPRARRPACPAAGPRRQLSQPATS